MDELGMELHGFFSVIYDVEQDDGAMLAEALMAVNDDETITDAARESSLWRLFKLCDVDVTFVN